MNGNTKYASQYCVYKSKYSLPKEKILKQWKEGRFITSATYTMNGWFVVMSKNSGISDQQYFYDSYWPAEWIQQQQENGYYINALSTSDDKLLIVTSKGLGYTDQLIVCNDSWEESSEEINQYWKQGFFITQAAWLGHKWCIVMSKNCRLKEQKWSMTKFEGLSELLKQKRDDGYRINLIEYGGGKCLLIYSKTEDGILPAQSFCLNEKYDEHIENGWNEKRSVMYLGGGMKKDKESDKDLRDHTSDAYKEGMRLCLTGNVKGALKVFEKASDAKDQDACYQLAHYYLFSSFDTAHYESNILNYGIVTGMNRKGMEPKDKKKGMHYLEKSRKKDIGKLLFQETAWLFNPGMACYYLIRDIDELLPLIHENPNICVNLHTMWSRFSEQIYMGGWDDSMTYSYKLFKEMEKLPSNSPTAKFNLMDWESEKILAVGAGFQKDNNIKEALYYYLRAAAKGNKNAMNMAFLASHEIRLQDIKKDNMKNYKKLEKIGHWDSLFGDLLETHLDDFPEYRIEMKELADMFSEIGKEKESNYRNAKIAKAERRRARWNNFMRGMAQSMAMASQAYGQYQAYNSGYAGGGNMDYLLDPRYAMQQTAYQNAEFQMMFNNMMQPYSQQIGTFQQEAARQMQFQFQNADQLNSTPLLDFSNFNWNAVPVGNVENYSEAYVTDYSSTSSSSVSSYSSSSKSGGQTCYLCHGTKKCWTCNGKMWYLESDFGTGKRLKCPNCTDGWCSHCHGSGLK